MPHSSLPPVPVLALPVEVVDELVRDGFAVPSPNPAAEFSAGDWWVGVLMITGATSNAITLTGAARAGCEALAIRLHRWNELRAQASANEGSSKPCQLVYQSTNGRARLDLDKRPSLSALQEWVEATYRILEADSTERQ